VLIDEAAHAPGVLDAWHYVIRPTLIDSRGSAWFVSTPNGLNDFHTLFQYGIDPERPEWVSMREPTSANPYLSREEVEEEMRDAPEMVRLQEYEAQFIELAGAVFRHIRACAIAPKGVMPDIHNRQYVAGIDLAKTRDYTVLKILDITDKEIGPVEVKSDRFQRLDWNIQIDRLETELLRWRPGMTLVDRTGIGDLPYTQLAKALSAHDLRSQGIFYDHATKVAQVEALALVFEREKIQIMDDLVTTGELLTYVAKKTPTGLITYGGAKEGYDDTVSALMLAYAAAGQRPIHDEDDDFADNWRENRDVLNLDTVRW
jgi:hypothetical protein